MSHFRARPSRSRASSVALPLRSAFMLLCGLAFLFQVFIAQTHIHVPGTADTASSYTVTAVAKALTKAPVQNQRDDLSKCPFCQAAMALGATVGPNLFYILEPPANGVVKALRELQRPAQAVRSYIWRSRGPPQH